MFSITHLPQALIYLRGQVTGMLRIGRHGWSECNCVFVCHVVCQIYKSVRKGRETRKKERKTKSENMKRGRQGIEDMGRSIRDSN